MKKPFSKDLQNIERNKTDKSGQVSAAELENNTFKEMYCNWHLQIYILL